MSFVEMGESRLLQAIEDAFNKAGEGVVTAVHFAEDFNKIDHDAMKSPFLYIANKINNIHRQRAFAAGRVLMNRCFTDLSLSPEMVTQSLSCAPCWHQHVTGSVSHCFHSVITAVSLFNVEKTHFSIGIDLEELNRIQPAIWSIVFTAAEVDFLNTLKPVDREKFATCFFSAKESFYKAQFPLTHQFIEYDDIEVQVGAGIQEGKIFIHHKVQQLKAFNITAFYFFYAQLVVTGVVIKAEKTVDS